MLRKRQEANGRARRFTIHIPVRYRLPRSPEWFEAYTENVSRSGVLFRTDRTFEPTTALDLRLELPPVDNGERVRGEVVCKGEVVRMDQSDDRDGVPSGVAVAIHRYWMTQIREQN
ncbi:MAG: PilZ domain-containing protein [Terriglobia bacterium]|jgi:PilZ domain-containing protein